MQATKMIILERTDINEKKSLSSRRKQLSRERLQKNTHLEPEWQQRDFYTVKIVQIHVYIISLFNDRNLLI